MHFNPIGTYGLYNYPKIAFGSPVGSFMKDDGTKDEGNDPEIQNFKFYPSKEDIISRKGIKSDSVTYTPEFENKMAEKLESYLLNNVHTKYGTYRLELIRILNSTSSAKDKAKIVFFMQNGDWFVGKTPGKKRGKFDIIAEDRISKDGNRNQLLKNYPEGEALAQYWVGLMLKNLPVDKTTKLATRRNTGNEQVS